MQGPFNELDIVGVNHLGREFLAIVEGESGPELHVRPLTRNVTYFTVNKREVVSHWPFRKVKGAKTPIIKDSGGITYS